MLFFLHMKDWGEVLGHVPLKQGQKPPPIAILVSPERHDSLAIKMERFRIVLVLYRKKWGEGLGHAPPKQPPPLSIFPVLIGVGWVAALILCCRRYVGAGFRVMFAGGGLALQYTYSAV